MWKHVTFVAAVLVLTGGPAGASIQAEKKVGWLGAGDWQLREYEGEAYLAKAPYDPGAQVRHPWSVSSPTINGPGGQLLGYATKGRGPEVRLVAKGEEGASP